MSRRARYALFMVGGALVAIFFVWGVIGMPSFGSSFHPYRDRAIPAAKAHATANAVSSVNFDQRGFDTLGEESILFASAVGVAALLRPSKQEREQRAVGGGRVMESTRLAGYLLMPITILIGLDVVTWGSITPGGGFQGGMVLATAVHLLYVAGNFPALDRLRPLALFESAEALGVMAFVGIGLGGLAVAGSYLANVIPFGTLGKLLSAGTVEPLNVATGVAVANAAIVILRHFLEQAIALEEVTPEQ